MVQILLQNSSGKVVFLRRGILWNLLGHQREWKYLGHFYVTTKWVMTNFLERKIVNACMRARNWSDFAEYLVPKFLVKLLNRVTQSIKFHDVQQDWVIRCVEK